MEGYIKRLSLLLLILLMSLLMVSCGIFEPLELKNEDYFTAVEFSEKETTVTIYLDGQAPVSPNIAFTKSLALMGRNFIEPAVVCAVTSTVYQYPLRH